MFIGITCICCLVSLLEVTVIEFRLGSDSVFIYGQMLCPSLATEKGTDIGYSQDLNIQGKLVVS